MKVEYGKIFITVGAIAAIVAFFMFVLSFTENTREIQNNPTVEIVDTVPEERVRDTIRLDRASYYNAIAGQTDSSPYGTADGSTIDNSKVKDGSQRWVALSRDLINDSFRNKAFGNGIHWTGKIKFGDTIEISSSSFPHINGKWVVHDCMNSRYSKSIDFLTYPGVRMFGGKGKITDVKIIL